MGIHLSHKQEVWKWAVQGWRKGSTRQERLMPFVSFCPIDKAPRFNNNKHHPAEFEFQTHDTSIQYKYVHTIFGTHLL